MWEDEFYIFDSQTISEKEFDEKVEYEDYRAFADSLMGDEVVEKLNELHEEVMDLRRENTKFKLTVSEIIEDMQKYVDDNQLIYINQSYLDWIKKEVDTTL